ncbi:MAG: hypothetical protein ACUVUC_00620 [Thermoguttaceae bacterium]
MATGHVWRGLVLAGLLVLGAAGAVGAYAGLVGAADFQVPLTVQESLGIPRRAEPISGGIPLPKGMFPRDQQFALLAQDGREIACQITPLVVETDGTLRWILLDFQDDVAAGATNRYLLRAGSAAARPPQPLKIEDRPDAVAVDTGRIKFVVSRKDPFGLFQRVAAEGKPVVIGGQASYVQMQGRSGWDDKSPWEPRQFVAGPPESLQVWYAGPLRVTLEVAGHFADDPLGAGYQAWITAWAGKSQVWVKYKLCNSNPEQYTAILVGRSALELRLAQSGPQTEAQPGGWISVSGAGTLLVCDKLFATNPPRRLAAGDGKLILEAIAQPVAQAKAETPPKPPQARPWWKAAGLWLYDCSHHSSEYLLDFAAPEDAAALARLADASRNRLWALAPGEYYSRCDVLGIGPFGTLEDEKTCYEKWGWTYQPRQVPEQARPRPGDFVPFEDNHYESEADSPQGLLMMYLRTGQRGWFDRGEAWARYHADLQAWRTDGWKWKDGAIWFPTGGPQGNLPVRKKWNFAWGPDWGPRQKDPDCADLWRLAQAKSCYCHFYGSGLVDYFLLTGDRDALAAALDNVEQKDEELRRFRRFTPGKSDIGCIRGFGRGFEVMMHVLQADPANRLVRELCQLSAQTLWQSPILDERGFHPSKIGGGFGGMPVKEITPNIRRWMDARGIRYTTTGQTVDTLVKGESRWPVCCYGGTWQHVYVQNGADLYARYFDDEDLRDFTIAFAQMSARYMLSPKCHQTWYYTYFDVPDRGMVFDPWAFEHTQTQDGEGCVHSGWYTRFYPDACARGYSLTGERPLLEKAREFWDYGSKRDYQTRHSSAGRNAVHRFAGHEPPKDDTVLEVSRLFWEAAHPREDDQAPAAISDLRVRLLRGGKAEVCFTAPADRGGGKVALYQVKADRLPIVPYEAWDPVGDLGKRRNWWRAVNCKGEPPPSRPGTPERFVVTGVPDGRPLYFAVRSYDQTRNRSPVSNLAVAE